MSNITMILYIILALILWFVVPLFIEGHIRKKTDRKAWSILSRIVAIALILLAIYRFLMGHLKKRVDSLLQ